MSLEHAQQLVTTYIATGETTLSPELLDLVNGGAGSLGLLGLVKALGAYLTGVDDEPRLRALALLSAVLAQSPKDRINRQSTRVLTDFYIDKLSDVLVLTPALQGLLTLSGLPTFGSSETLALVPALLKINMRSLAQATRYLVFRTIDTLMHLHRPALIRLGPDGFVKPYCTRIADGEKDPRNLLIAFSLAKVIILEFDIDTAIEELFDVTYCYFPITYRPPPRDPYGISTEDLRTALRACLAGSPLLARQAMPVLLEKLSGSGGEMKIDTLRTTESCLPVFGRDNAQAHQAELWEGLKVEVMYTSSDEAEAAALRTMKVFLRVLVGDDASAESDFFDGVILEELEVTLREPEKSLAAQIVKMVGAAFAASARLGRKTYGKILPQLLGQFHAASTSITQKQALLTSISALIHAAAALYAVSGETRTAASDGILIDLKDQLLGCLSAGLDVDEGRLAAMEGLMGLLPWLETNERSYVVSKIGSLLGADGVGDDIREHALNNLAEIAKTDSALIEAQILPALFKMLPDLAPMMDEDDARVAYRRTLACLGVLAVEPTLFALLVKHVLAKLDSLSYAEGSAEAAVYAFALLVTVEKVLRKKSEAKHPDLPAFADELLPSLFAFYVRGGAEPGQSSLAAEPRLVVVGGKIVELVVQSLPVNKQNDFVAKLHAAFVDGQVALITQQPSKSGTAVAPLAADAPASQRNLLVLYSSGMIALRPDVKLPIADLSTFLGDVLQWSLSTSTTALQLKSMFHLFASLSNKRCDRLSSMLEHVVPSFWSAEVTNQQAARVRRMRSIRAWVWLCRALLVRNHGLGYTFLSQLLDLLATEKDQQLVLEAAKALAIIADGDGDGVLTKENHAIIRLLYKQKFFNFVIPKVEQGFAVAKGTDRAVVYLVVLASIIPALPQALCISFLPTLLPFLLRSLDLPDADLKANVIQTLEQAAQVDDASSQEVIERQAVTIVEALLRCLDVSASNERSRMAALRTLAALPDVIRYDVLHPVKATVLRQLGRALDDKRRSVRKEAVDCRARWFLFSG